MTLHTCDASARPRIIVVTPAYNAEQTIAEVYRRFSGTLRERIAEFVVVDDGSQDGTGVVLQRLARDNANLIVLRHEQNEGYGAALKTLLDYALQSNADVAAVVHADGQYAPESLTDRKAKPP
jgi:glycosyltransferase involved in cell wall biosynthesis